MRGLASRRAARPALALAVAGAVAVASGLAPAASNGRPAGPSHATARAVAPAAAARPRCYGAAARDPEHQPCRNRRLRLSVSPRPGDALIAPSSPCAPVERGQTPEVCAFGVSPARAAATVALVGDSHAVHWRAALDVVARAKRWRAVSIYRSRCPLTAATTSLPEPAAAQCAAWKQETLAWFARHPEVNTVFVSANSGAPVGVAPGQDSFAAKVSGYVTAWNALPPSVAHIVVLGDVPHNRPGTNACVERAIARHRRPGPACAVPRAVALKRDPALVAAARLRGASRVQSIDLSRFMCDPRRCFPVVGGVLVHKDVGHLTRLFATTLGPFLLRDVTALMASWR